MSKINDKFKHHWKENIKPALAMMLIGALMICGMRLADIAWPEKSAKLVICFASDIGRVQACEPFADALSAGE